jgi:FixJ family two-component response regulator
LLNPYIIVVSGGVNLNLSKDEDGLGNYMDDFIAKPFEENELMDLIKKA